MAKAKQAKRIHPAQAHSALEGLRVEQRPEPNGESAAVLPRKPARKPTQEEQALIEKLIRAIESI